MGLAGIGSNWRKIELLQSTLRSERAKSHVINTATSSNLQVKLAQLASAGMLRLRQKTLSARAKLRWKSISHNAPSATHIILPQCVFQGSRPLLPTASKPKSGMHDALKLFPACASVRHQLLHGAIGHPLPPFQV